MVSKKSLGMMLIALGITLPIVAYVAGHIFNMEVASYGGPPNQGAMVLAYLVIQGSLVIGACLALVGLVLLLAAPRQRHDGKIKNLR